tara:strand:+ start:524 stop:901 length:378 start_codon:yes stop_codon:yes gene_type:complete
MYELIWFLCGAVSYKLLSKLLALGQATAVFRTLEINLLVMLSSLTEDIAFIKALRYKVMEESGLPPDQIEKNRDADDEFFQVWKASCVQNMHKTVPPYIKPSFKTWNEGMNLVSKFYREYKNGGK